MNEVCPICGQYANIEKIYESNQGYTNSVGKFAAKQGGKYIGKSIGSLVGDLIGLSEVGELVGGMLGSYAAGAGLDEYANRQGPYHYHYNCKHCTLEWDSTDHELSIVNQWFMTIHRNKTRPWVRMLTIIAIPYWIMAVLLALSGIVYVVTFSIFDFTGWAWNLVCSYFSFTWIVYIVLMLITICHEPFISSHRMNEHIKGVCMRYNLTFGTEQYNNGVYEGTFNTDNEKHGYGIYKWNDGKIYEGTFENDKIVGYGIGSIGRVEKKVRSNKSGKLNHPTQKTYQQLGLSDNNNQVLGIINNATNDDKNVIAKLIELYDAGVISKKEFEAQISKMQ